MRIKGTSIASFLGFLQTEFGASRVKEFVATLEPNLRKRCEGLVLASAFYPVEELDGIARKARDYFQPNASFFERSGAHNATVGLEGVHRSLLARPTPLDFLKAAERSWGQFADSGTVKTDIVGDGSARVRIEGFPGSEVVCARGTGFLTRSLELAGAQSLAVRKTACTRSGALVCEWNITWDADRSPQPQALTTGLRRPMAG